MMRHVDEEMTPILQVKDAAAVAWHDRLGFTQQVKSHISAPLVSLLLLVAGCADSPAEPYQEGYRFGQGGPAAHLGTPTSADNTAGTGAAESECGEHAETDGVEPFPPSQDWMAGCIDGALGRPASPSTTRQPR
ncbi:hypothetical protein GCM10010381_54280 [Streptomyces xantholiticus]|nr:hypothetical protein GCM10010381_54280 [Streptomyces xantholiticus]